MKKDGEIDVKTLEQIALEVANGIPCPAAFDWGEADVIEFAHRFLSEWKKQQVAVAVLSCDGQGYWYPDNTGTKLYTLNTEEE